MEYIDKLFEQHKWSLYNKKSNSSVFRRNETEFFEIKEGVDGKVKVSFPLNNSTYNYTTEISGFSNTYDFVSEKLEYLD